MKMIKQPMIMPLGFAAILALTMPFPGAVFGQAAQQLPAVPAALPAQPPAPVLTKFSIDFPGGGPKDLVQAIQKATSKQINVIIPDDVTDVNIPALKMQNIDAAQLFRALEGASQRSGVNVNSAQGLFARTSYGFRPGGSGTLSDDTIWYFSVERPTPAVSAAQPYQPPAPVLTKFSIDFPGGGPKDLVLAIQKATGKQINVIIPDDVSDVKIPAFKMQNVDAYQLFRVLEAASERTESVKFGQNYSTFNTAYGFRPGGTSGGPSDETVWYFSARRPNPPPPPFRTCQFYSLAPYLEEGLTVDDIITAIKTGSKMLWENEGPTISFHKDTKLLIATGEPEKLQIIDSVLKALVRNETNQERLTRILGAKKAQEGEGSAKAPATNSGAK